MIFEICILVIMIIVSVRDIRKKEILAVEIILAAAVSSANIVWMACKGNFDIISLLISFLPGVIMLFVAMITGQSLGYGDGLLALVAGPGLGAGLICGGMAAALFICSIFSGILLLTKKANPRTRVPFVPFMTIGLAVMEIAKI